MKQPLVGGDEMLPHQQSYSSSVDRSGNGVGNWKRLSSSPLLRVEGDDDRNFHLN
jgi:hypothetical protein